MLKRWGRSSRTPWNRGKLVGQKHPLTPQQIWSIRLQLEAIGNRRDLALFNTALDSKLRACDLLEIRVSDVFASGAIKDRATVLQQKTGRPVRFELTPRTRDSIECWIASASLKSSDYLFPSRNRESPHLSTRQYARIVKAWVTRIGLDATSYGTHTMRRTKATILYRRTKNLRAVQLLLTLAGLQAAECEKHKLIHDVALKAKLSYEDAAPFAAPFVESKLSTSVPRDPAQANLSQKEAKTRFRARYGHFDETDKR